jgi:ELWxxDGT repeat protein
MKQAPTRVAALVIALGGALAASLAGAQSLELVGPIDTGQSQFSGSSALPLGTVGKFVLFSASSETVAQGLWSTDGTSYGTQLVAEACPGGCQISPGLLGSDGRVAYVEVEVVGQVPAGTSHSHRPCLMGQETLPCAAFGAALTPGCGAGMKPALSSLGAGPSGGGLTCAVSLPVGKSDKVTRSVPVPGVTICSSLQ